MLFRVPCTGYWAIWIIEPQTGREELITSTLDYNKVRQERHNFDPSGHYSRPDVTQLTVNRKRQSTINLDGEEMT